MKRAFSVVVPLTVAGALAGAACSSSSTPPMSMTATDAGKDSYVAPKKKDAGHDSGFDAGVDSTVPMDAGHDSGHAKKDVYVAPHDAGIDTGFDAGVDTGVDTGTDAGITAFIPSNFTLASLSQTDASADAGVDWTGAPDVEIGTNDLPAPRTVMVKGGLTANVYLLRSLTVPAGQSLDFSTTGTCKYASPNPVILYVQLKVDIEGSVNVISETGCGNGAGTQDPGIGAGVPGGSANYENSGPGGGSYCGVGGSGSASSGNAAPGGTTYGGPPIIPLYGGSNGGQNGNASGSGYAGGGAIQISAGVSITVGASGVINAGGAGAAGTAPSAGGSGGAILLEAATVDVLGTLAANGGGGAAEHGPDPSANAGPSATPSPGGGGGGNGSGGATIAGGNAVLADAGMGSIGGGGGGAGRIRINTESGSLSDGGVGVFSPSLGTTCATVGPLLH